MEPKSNLNNTQRKLLDQIYTQEIEERRKKYQSDRNDIRKKKIAEIRKDMTVSGETAKLLKAAQEFHKLYYKLKEAKKLNGVTIGNLTIYKDAPTLNVTDYSYEPGLKPDALKKFDTDTADKLTGFNRAKLEVRTRIYGMSTTFDEIRKDLDSYLKELES